MKKPVERKSNINLGPSDFFFMGQQALGQTPQCKQFVDSMWPLSARYASPLNPIFLVEIGSLDLLRQRPFWMIRDGLIPLLWFFELHPEPKLKNFSSKLLVSEDLAPFIPAPWRNYFGTYQKVSRHSADVSGADRRLLIAGVVSENFCSLDFLESDLKKIREWVETRKTSKRQQTEALVFLPTQGDISSAFVSQYIVNVCQAIGGDMRCLSWQKFSTLDGLENCDFLELNDGQICKDSFLEEFALSSGALPIGRQHLPVAAEMGSGTRYVELSPHHGLVVKAEVSEKSELSEALNAGNERSPIYQKYHRALRSKAHGRFPWPQWLSAWESPKGRNGATHR